MKEERKISNPVTVRLTDETGVPTREAVLAYLENRLSPAQKDEFEKLAAEDSLFTEALEGYLEHFDKVQFTAETAEFDRLIEEKTGYKNKRGILVNLNPKPFFAVAAIVLVLVGLGILAKVLIPASDNRMALEESAQPPSGKLTDEAAKSETGYFLDRTAQVRQEETELTDAFSAIGKAEAGNGITLEATQSSPIAAQQAPATPIAEKAVIPAQKKEESSTIQTPKTAGQTASPSQNQQTSTAQTDARFDVAEVSFDDDQPFIEDLAMAETVKSDFATSETDGRNTAMPTASESLENDLKKNRQKETVFTVVENMPEFSGGEKALQTFLKNNLKYPPEAAKQGIVGTTYVQFIVDKTGKITNASVVKSAHPLLDEEALRIVNAMPLWKPGFERGKPVRVQYVLPVKFTIP